MGKVEEAQKTTRETQYFFSFCVNIGKIDVSRDPFFRLSLCKIIVRRTISSYNKELYFLVGESTVEFQMFAMGWLDVNYFCFNLFP